MGDIRTQRYKYFVVYRAKNNTVTIECCEKKHKCNRFVNELGANRIIDIFKGYRLPFEAKEKVFF
jgi:hypothetical protein